MTAALGDIIEYVSETGLFFSRGAGREGQPILIVGKPGQLDNKEQYNHNGNTT